MSKKSPFRRPFDKYHGKPAEILFEADRQHFYHTYCSLTRIFRLKKSLRVIFKILALFVNLFSEDNKYSLLNIANLLQHFQMQLSKKRKLFSKLFFFPFSKFRFNFQHFQKKDDPQSWCIFEVTNSEKVG